MRKVYYNENDPYAVRWLKNLMRENLIPKGVIDDRSIEDVKSNELRGFTQCHFFAGIAGWALALQIAKWPNHRHVWTGSCPCQPFSVAGKKEGIKDKRHLWPAWFNLIRKCNPSTVFGEQVARAFTAGWFDMVADDLEKEGYKVGSSILPACSVGAPHRRDRLFFVGDTEYHGLSAAQITGGPAEKCKDDPEGSLEAQQPQRTGGQENNAALANSDSERGKTDSTFPLREREYALNGSSSADSRHSGWSTEPGMGKLAHGISCRMGKLRALGNAIVPGLAAEFIKSYLEINS